MSKYDSGGFGAPKVSIEEMLSSGETVIWKGKPKKSAFIINKSLIMMPIALIWLLIDIGIIIGISKTGGFSFIGFFLVPFFALHLMPVWMWLSNVLTAKRRWENTQYVVTDKRIIIQTGFVGMEYKTIYYKEITDVQLKIGIIDKMLGVGDIYFQVNGAKNQAFLDIEDVYAVYPKIQKIVLDIQTDIHYPNNLRPSENSGYNTQYKG